MNSLFGQNDFLGADAPSLRHVFNVACLNKQLREQNIQDHFDAQNDFTDKAVEAALSGNHALAAKYMAIANRNFVKALRLLTPERV